MLLLCSCIKAGAQNQTEDIAAQLPALRQGLGLSVVHWLDPIQPGVYLSYQHQRRRLLFVRYQMGYLLFLNYSDQDGIQNLNGLRLRTSLRQYREPLIDRGNAPFWEAAVDYRYLDVTIAGDFSRSNFQFQQRMDYSMWQHSFSLNVLAGFSLAFSQQVRFDVGIGAGLRLNYRQFSPVPEDSFFSTNGNPWLWKYGAREGFHATLSMPVIMDLCYFW
ncbi:MAG: hypothetical protein D6772_05215 [Bacteroidetes bacterium]|nr:MAG: hypothetical protein D6772_05215 [Bacteroidota bacterium]